MLTTVADMGKRKSNGESAKRADQHRPRKMTAVRGHFIEPAMELVHRLGMADLTELVNQALREKLEREGLWPWKPGGKTPAGG